ncbi:hypothetical protein GCM10023082_63870 [Streptomyces tremellae]|uniref:Uncharacterized protein n=1 Tax=Streptomyces tremellae TaxID=1124239 RepID=A0ABP7GDL4_9ACTN
MSCIPSRWVAIRRCSHAASRYGPRPRAWAARAKSETVMVAGRPPHVCGHLAEAVNQDRP